MPNQDVELFVVIERLKDLVTAPPPEPPLREIDRGEWWFGRWI
jgi:hypothetical protein